MLLASRRHVGDDGVYVSARETSEKFGIDLDLLQRVQRAMGLSREDDPDAVVHLRADAEAAARAQRFIDFGLDPDQVVQVVRVLSEGLAKAAEVMRYTAFAAVLTPVRRSCRSPRSLRRWFGNSPDARPDGRGHAVAAAASRDGDRGGVGDRAGRGSAAARRP